MDDLVFRDARLEDIPMLLALSHAGDARGAETPPLDPGAASDPRVLGAFEAICADPAHRLIVVESDGEAVGTFQISLLPGLPNHGLRRGLIENVHVRSDRRGGGIGSAMMRWAIEYCREQGCGVVQLTSNKVRQDAHRFYRALGFQQSHEGFKLYT